MIPPKYKCPECGWVGTEREMEADCSGEPVADETWSSWICPTCKRWWQLEDYEIVHEHDPVVISLLQRWPGTTKIWMGEKLIWSET